MAEICKNVEADFLEYRNLTELPVKIENTDQRNSKQTAAIISVKKRSRM